MGECNKTNAIIKIQSWWRYIYIYNYLFIKGDHVCGDDMGGNWELNCNIYKLSIRELFKNGELKIENKRYVDHDEICWKYKTNPVRRKNSNRYKKCDIHYPGILVETRDNPLKLPYRMIDGAHRMLKRYIEYPELYDSGSYFYVISEYTMYKYLRRVV